MPTYQYRCEACNNDFEVVQSFTDPTLTVHEPGCGGTVHKRFNAVGVVFKGTGFYRNDSRGKEPSAGGEGGGKAGESVAAKSGDGSAPAKTGEGAGATKTEAKPAASTSGSGSSGSGSAGSGSSGSGSSGSGSSGSGSSGSGSASSGAANSGSASSSSAA